MMTICVGGFIFRVDLVYPDLLCILSCYLFPGNFFACAITGIGSVCMPCNEYKSQHQPFHI